LAPAQRPQILVAGYDNVGVDREGRRDDVIVIGIAADAANLRQRGGKQPRDLFRFRTPRNDRLVVMAVDVPQAGRRKSIAGRVHR